MKRAGAALPARAGAGLERRRRAAAGARLLRGDHRAGAARHRPGAGAPRGDRQRPRLDRPGAGIPALARADVRARLRGRRARSAWPWGRRRWRRSRRSSAWRTGPPPARRWRSPRRSPPSRWARRSPLAPLIFGTAAVGGLAFAFVGGLGAALALGSRRGGLIIALIVLPLIAPPVIFGGGALDAFAAGLDWRTGFLMLTAYALAAAALYPVRHGRRLPQRALLRPAPQRRRLRSSLKQSGPQADIRRQTGARTYGLPTTRTEPSHELPLPPPGAHRRPRPAAGDRDRGLRAGRSPGAARAGAADAGAHRHHRDPAEMRAHMADHLRTVLQLQASQDTALNAFLDALKPPAGAKEHLGEHGGRQAGEMQHMSTPERLDRMAARMDEQRAPHAGAHRRHQAVLRPAVAQPAEGVRRPRRR